MLIIVDPTGDKRSTKSCNCAIVYKLNYCNSLRMLRDVTFQIKFIVSYYIRKELK